MFEEFLMVLGMLALLLLSPFFVYVLIKVGTYAYLAGRQRFRDYQVYKGRDSDGTGR